MRAGTLLMIWLSVTCARTWAGEIHDLATEGSLEKLKKLIQANPAAVNERNPTQATPLHLAALHGRADVVDFLLKSGADPTAVNFQKNMPGHFAAARGHLEVVKKLLASKPDLLNARGGSGTTMLMLASRTNSTLATFLVTNKADVNLQNDLGGTALRYAEMRGHTELAALLRRCGAK